MRNLLTDIKHDQHGLILVVSVKSRGSEHEIRVQCPWKWLATDDVMDRLQRERDRLHRPSADPIRPYLPLETWE